MITRLRKYQNKLDFSSPENPFINKINFVKGPIEDSTSLPKTLSYEDIDKAFKEWVENDLNINFEGKRIPTYSMLSLQRFNEYMQNWSGVDENKNMLMNFKVITRENNPKPGTLLGERKNIPGEKLFLLRRVQLTDKNGRPYFIEYRRKEPTCVDFSYNVSIVSNKIEFLNEFNTLVLDKFKSIQAYIFPNGYACPLTLEDISDESEYNLNDRQFFTQTFSIKLRGYVVKESDFVVEEVPVPKIMCFSDVSKNSAVVEIESFGDCGETPYYYQPIKLSIIFKPEERKVKFKINTNFTVDNIILNNVRDNFYVKINDQVVDNKFTANENDEIYIYNVRKLNPYEGGSIVFEGFNPDVVYDERKDNEEIASDSNQETIEINVVENNNEANE